MRTIVNPNKWEKIPANDDSPLYGQVNYYGNLQKQRGKTGRFHSRWVVMRGFYLFWYRSVNDKAQKGVTTLPEEPIRFRTIGKGHKCFILEKEKKDSRQLAFLDSDTGREFRMRIAN